MDYIIDIYAKKAGWWLKKYPYVTVHGPYGDYFRVTGEYALIKKIGRKASFRNIKHRIYSKQWSRSGNYRNIFIKNNQPPYRCRYCNKPLKEEQMTVDHIIPVYQAKTSMNARAMLGLLNIKDVNDIKNLAPACNRCNKKKDSRMGKWMIRGFLGKYKAFWIARRVYYALLITLFIIGGYLLYKHDFVTDVCVPLFRYVAEILDKVR